MLRERTRICPGPLGIPAENACPRRTRGSGRQRKGPVKMLRFWTGFENLGMMQIMVGQVVTTPLEDWT